MAIVVFGVVTLVFILLRVAAGDPAGLMNPPGQQEDIVQQTRERLGTDRPILEQYVDYVLGVGRGDLGASFHGGHPVLAEVLGALPNTIALAVVAIVFSSTVGLILGIGAALRPNGAFDRGVLVYVSIALATPSFWLAVVLVLIFSVRLAWLPAIDMEGPESFVLPVITLAVALTPVLIRTTRQSFLETLGDDHVRAARARGIPERRVILVHGLKVAALPLITLIGLQAGLVMAGSYVVESIFNWPGLGKLTLDAVAGRDFPMIQGCVLVAALVFVVVNFFVDLTYAALDPRDPSQLPMTDIATGGAALHRLDAGTRPSRLRLFLRRRSFIVGVTILATIITLAVLAPVIAPADPNKQDLSATLLPPVWVDGGSWTHPMGTDALGRDVASRLLYGARNSLTIAFFAVLIAATLGLIAGLAAGFSRNWWDAVLMRMGDMQLAFPFILLAIIVLGVIRDRSAWHIILVLGIPGWILYARVVRARVLAERDKDYITAARSIGASQLRQLRRYVLPSVWQVVMVIALLDLGFVILVESTLSFLGFGLPQSTPSWGSILAEGRKNIAIAPWLAIIPGLAIVITVLAVNLTADGAADVLDPKLKKGAFRRLRLSGAIDSIDPSITPAGGERTGTAVAAPILEVDDLRVEFRFDDRTIRAVRGVSFGMQRGRTLGIVGESGSGKSVTALSILQLLDAPGRVTSGRILFEGSDLARIDDHTMAALRGTKIGMIFQNPGSSLDPVMSVGSQMVETIRSHASVSAADARDLARSALADVGIADADRVMGRYPFQMSGGMNQRVMIAMAMTTRPDLLIADEPTTALDVTTQAQVLDQLVAITRDHDTALILITHDIALVSEYADDIVVMYAGIVVESGTVDDVIGRAWHPYTQALLESVPRVDLVAGERLAAIPGELPDPAVMIVGCPFADRCRYVMDVCRSIEPPLTVHEGVHAAACHLVDMPAAVASR